MKNYLEAGKFGKLTLKNRIIYPGMTYKVSDNKGHLVDSEVDAMVYRAEQEHGPAIITFPGLNDTMVGKVRAVNINDEESMYIMSKQIERVKINDTKTMAIIGILGLRPGDYNNRENLGPSNMNFPFDIKEMTKEEIHIFTEKFADLAYRAKVVGFDSLRIQTGTSKKLLDLFVSPYTNRRTDEYGGSVENRARIVLEILAAVRAKVGDMPIQFNLLMEEWLNHGTTMKEGIELAKILAPHVDSFEPVAMSRHKGAALHGEPFFTDYGPMMPYTKAVKEACPDSMVVASVRMGNGALMEKVIANGEADFISLGRPIFADPQWVSKTAAGKPQEIVHCIACMNCYTESSRKELYPECHRACTVNPANLREREFYDLKPTETPKKILVAGGGLAGMEAAWTLSARGHDVTLCEATGELGGQWISAACGEGKQDYLTLIPAKERQLEKYKVKVSLNTKVDKAYLEKMKPDVTVLATGAVPREIKFDFPLGDVNVVQGVDVLLDKAEVGQEVVVVGGRYIGMESACKLAKQGKKVTIVDMVEPSKGLNPMLSDHYFQDMFKLGVKMFYNTQVVSFTPSGVDLLYGVSLLSVPAQTVVLAAGTVPMTALKKDLEALNLSYCTIGDCKRIGDAMYSIRDGAELGRTL